MAGSCFLRWVSGLVMLLGVAVAVVFAAPQQTPQEIADQCLGEMDRVAGNALKSISFVSGDCNDEFAQLFADLQPSSKYFTAAGKCVAEVEKLNAKAQQQIEKLATKCINKLQARDASQLLIDSIDDAASGYGQDLGAAAFAEANQIYGNLGPAAFPE